MGAIEIVQTLVSPTEKLIDAISSAIGKAYEPKHVRQMADAKAYELKLIAETVRSNSDVPIVYNSNGVAIDTSNFEEIAKRASSRLAYQEIAKQQNIEAVADYAYDELGCLDTVSNEPVNPDWMFRFFNSVENISDVEMQKLWGHILAGEIRTPNTYSYRTLEKLKNMTQKEAQIFQKIAAMALENEGIYFLFENSEILKRYGIHFVHLLKMQECGLIEVSTVSLTLTGSLENADYIANSKVIALFYGQNKDPQKETINVYLFTESGAQLIKGLSIPSNEQYIIDCVNSICEVKSKFRITAHHINCIREDKSINYDPNDILSSMEI